MEKFRRSKASDAMDQVFAKTGESFAELAARIGVSTPAALKYYRGQQKPRPARAKKIAAAEPLLPLSVWGYPDNE